MKITYIRCHVMCPIQDNLGGPRSRSFVEVETDEGIIGIGEATTEFHEMAVKTQIEFELRNRFVGEDPADVERLWQIGYRDFWWRRGIVHTSAMSGVDMALWDIKGKAAGLPVYELLGGKVRNRPVALAAVAHAAAAIQNFDIVEHCPIQPWFDDVQTLNLPLSAGYIDMDTLGTRPGLGVELDMDFVRSRSCHIPAGGQGYDQADGSLPLI